MLGNPKVQHYRQVRVAWKLLGYGSVPEQDPPLPWRQTCLHQEESPSEAGTHNDKTFNRDRRDRNHMNYRSASHKSHRVCLGTNLINQLRSLFDPSPLIIVQNRAGAAGQTHLTLNLFQSSGGKNYRGQTIHLLNLT